MRSDELELHEAAARDVIAALERLSSHVQASPDFLARVMTKADRLPVPRKRFREKVFDWLARWTTSRGMTGDAGLALGRFRNMPAALGTLWQAAVPAVLVLALIGAIPQYTSWFNRYVRGVRSTPAQEVTQRETAARMSSTSRDDNMTSRSILFPGLNAQRLKFLLEAVPNISRVAVFMHPAEPTHELAVEELTAVARSLGLTLHIQNVRDPDEFDSAFSALTSGHAEALLVLPDPVFYIHRAQIAELAEKNRLPTMFGVRRYVDAGGLISYGVSAPDIDRRIATYADPDINRRVAVSMGTLLKGAQPPEPRMEAPTKFELAINLKTAQALGLTIPQSLLSQADEVIE